MNYSNNKLLLIEVTALVWINEPTTFNRLGEARYLVIRPIFQIEYKYLKPECDEQREKLLKKLLKDHLLKVFPIEYEAKLYDILSVSII